MPGFRSGRAKHDTSSGLKVDSHKFRIMDALHLHSTAQLTKYNTPLYAIDEALMGLSGRAHPGPVLGRVGAQAPGLRFPAPTPSAYSPQPVYAPSNITVQFWHLS